MTQIGFILLCTVAAAAPLSTEKEQNSYALGQEVANSIKLLDADLDINALLQGVRDNLEGKASKLSAPDLAKVRTRAYQSMLQNREKKRAADKAKYSKAGQDFLTQNKKEKGVVTTPSGLQYVALSSTTNPRPGPKSRVKFDYKATVVGGTEVDSSFARGQPAVLGVDQGISGWKEAFQLMPAGSRYRFVIPPNLAYGEEGLPGKIPPNATLVYEITLHEVVR
jgi:FKBP-type peptidyl-prolyl cis-trans isomerase